MHEYGIAQALIESVEAHIQERRASRVTRLRVGIGVLSGVEPALLASAFESLRERTRCDGAELRIRTIDVRWKCPECGRGVGQGEALRCARCGCAVRLDRGDEVLLERIEMEVSDVRDVRVR